jgi:hypothetical protein
MDKRLEQVEAIRGDHYSIVAKYREGEGGMKSIDAYIHFIVGGKLIWKKKGIGFAEEHLTAEYWQNFLADVKAFAEKHQGYLLEALESGQSL